MPSCFDGLFQELTQDWLQKEIQQFMVQWRKENQCEDYWREPLVGIASATDPLFSQLHRAVDASHALPRDILQNAESVIAFFLPFKQWLGKENDRHGTHAARSWAESYVMTNRLIGEINFHLKTRFQELGHEAAITPATHNFDEEKLISRWSHKHMAYVAGLGTFGHHHLLITPAGCCGRLGSMATSMPLQPTPRPEGEFCLLKAGHRCFACVSKCRYEALYKTHFDRHSCYRQLLKNDAYYSDLPLVDVCGKCACEVPCSYQAPPLP